jgi:baseplate J-like protein
MNAPACPCDEFVYPLIPSNPPGRTHIAYRHADFLSVRHALLLALPGEAHLAGWRPSAQQDLALQMVEWWAYLAEVLTFYNERSANQAYLRTADLPESVHRLVRILGYRPRPGIGATGTVAALLSGPNPVTIPRGFQLQNKPGPGQQPQLFEVDATTPAVAPAAVPAAPEPDGLLVHKVNGADSILLGGTVTAVHPGDDLLLRPSAGAGKPVWARVRAVSPDQDPAGARNTRVEFTTALGLDTAPAAGYRVMRSALSARPWPYPTDDGVVIKADQLDLDSVARQIVVGDPVVMEIPGQSPPARAVVTVTSYAELIFYANGKRSDPTQLPDGGLPAGVALVPILHTRITFVALPGAAFDATTFDAKRGSVVVRFGWQDVGWPVTRAVSAVPVNATSLILVPAGPDQFPPTGAGTATLMEDQTGAGLRALASGGPSSINLTELSARTKPLLAPLRALFALLPVSRGASVRQEPLGSGDATVPGQEFVLSKAPLTYLPSADPSAEAGYASTLSVFVEGVRWTEASSFYGQPPDARVFVSREGPDGKTRVQFGDGFNGARLPSGIGNVTADYRYGSGADAPDAGSLTVVVKPLPGLKGIRNPVAVGGGADPDPPDQLRRYAPASVLTFGRAVSADDYETIAATAPGVARARSYWRFDPQEQRALVTVYVGDDEAAVTSAQNALAAAEDPNRPITVKLAAPTPLTLELTLRIDLPPEPVMAEVTAALTDASVGLFGQRVVRIGQPVFLSAIDAACLAVPGVLAVHKLTVRVDRGSGPVVAAGPRLDPGEGAFFQLPDKGRLTLHPESGDRR